MRPKRKSRPLERYEPCEEVQDDSDREPARIDLGLGKKRKREAPLNRAQHVELNTPRARGRMEPIAYEYPLGAPYSAEDMANSDDDDARDTAGGSESDVIDVPRRPGDVVGELHRRAAKKKKQFEASRKARERKERQKNTEKIKKQRETLQRVKNLQDNPRRELISLVPCRTRPRASEDGTPHTGRTEKAMRWNITTQDGQTKTLPGVTTVLNRVMFSGTEECKYNTVPPDVVGFDKPTQGPGYASAELGSARGTNLQDVCGYDAEAQQQARKGQYRCVGRGIEHGRRVHEQLGRLVQRWIVDGAQFPTTYASDEMTAGRLDPCVAKIVALLLEIDWTPIWSEYQIFDETLGFATAVDLVCTTHGVQRLAFIEIKTSTRRNAFELFMRGDGASTKFMRGPLQNHVLDTGRNRAAMQLMATEAVMQSSYLDCRPHSYQILFVSSDMEKPKLLTLPEWCWEGADGQLGLNRRIIRNMVATYAKHSRMESAVRNRIQALQIDPDDAWQRELEEFSSPSPPQSRAQDETDEPPIRLAPRTPAPPLPVRE